MVAVKEWVTVCQSTGHNIREDLKVQQHCCENLKNRNPQHTILAKYKTTSENKTI